MKKLAVLISAVIFLFYCFLPAFASEEGTGDIPGSEVPCAILMEAKTREIIYEKNAYEHRAPASVTKIMTMLLAAEAVNKGIVSLEDTVTASARAASMGGSQIWLEEGEQMSFGEMLKCITVVSANDCCVAIAEYLAGSEEAFVEKMNQRSKELGLTNTNFLCCSGLSDSDEHFSCAYDLAIISREVLKYEFIKDYTKLWTDSIRGGEFILNNTNKLIYNYPGATGLKTGFTSKAMHCLAASAERDGTEYIAVILGAESSAARFEGAKKLLNHAFANYTLISLESVCSLPPLKVSMGKKDCLNATFGDNAYLVIKKDLGSSLTFVPDLPEQINAPVEEGQILGTIKILSDDTLIRQVPVLSGEAIESMAFMDLFRTLISSVTDF